MELDAGETAQDAGIAAIAAGEREFGEELGNPLIKNRAVVAASLVTEGTGKPTFADPGRPAQDQIVVRVDPLAIGELVEESAVEAAWGPVIDVLDAGLLAQSGIAQPGGKPLVAAMGELAINQQPEPVGVSEHGGFVGSFELGKRLGHAGQAKLAQLVEHWMGKHCILLSGSSAVRECWWRIGTPLVGGCCAVWRSILLSRMGRSACRSRLPAWRRLPGDR